MGQGDAQVMPRWDQGDAQVMLRWDQDDAQVRAQVGPHPLCSQTHPAQLEFTPQPLLALEFPSLGPAPARTGASC